MAAQAKRSRAPAPESASVLGLGQAWMRAVAAGLLLAASLPPWGFWPLAIVGMALWVEMLTETGYWRRAGLSALVSVGWLGPATVWMVDLTVVGWPLAVLAFAAMHAVAGALVPPDHRRHAAFPAAFALAELLRWTWPFGGVPLATMAMAQVSSPLGAAARIGGPLLLAALTAVGGVTLAAILSARLRPAMVGLAVLAAAWLAAFVAPGSEPIDVDGNRGEDVGITVAAVQGGGPQNTRADACEQRAVFERHLDTTLEQVTTPVDLVVWPEDVVHPSPDTAITPARCDQPLLTDSEARAALSDLARELDTVLIAGFFERTADREANRNYAAAYDSSGAPVDTYEKVQLVPFGEYVPLRSNGRAVQRRAAGQGRPGGTLRRARGPRHAAGTAGRGHLLGDLLRPPGPQRDRRRRRPGAAQPHQRLQLLADRCPDPADRLQPPEGDRDGPVGGAGRAHRLLGGDHTRGRRDRADRHLREQGDPDDR